MTRVGGHSHAASLGAQAQTVRERSQQATLARFAVLYRGTATFGYARTQQMAMRGSLLARKLAALNARKRNAARRTGMRRPLVVTGNDAHEHAADSGDSGRIQRDGGGGGRGNDQSPHDGRDGADRNGNMPRAQIRTRIGHAVIAPPAPGALQKYLSAQGLCSDRDLAQALPRLWCETLLALRDEAAARPQARLDALLHEHFIDLLAVQQQTGASGGISGGISGDASSGTSGDASMGAWRQRLIDASGERDAAPQAGTSAEKISRAGRLNLLMPLLLLSYGRPSTPAMRERAMNVRIVQRGAALTAAQRG
ncbi:hypothetical protein [Paraburkholderia phenoliruptrix]|uniref:hypothetical protein n=1 Tax=Paraburkholderia phenoliruptrix TaxID=252970 RepID=UPI001C6ECFEC|nr:hypothetical protein [Paraburkholderia phenoliruptrix]MBW9102115.1 hypothetical protein [Paraburkholderia phenoliruptrix]MBW9131226.1 hypothetical protein [Paraburkholderia ginsengiterrae]